MAKSTVVPFELPSEFSPDPLTEVIQVGAKELLRTAVQAEVSRSSPSTRIFWTMKAASVWCATAFLPSAR